MVLQPKNDEEYEDNLSSDEDSDLELVGQFEPLAPEADLGGIPEPDKKPEPSDVGAVNRATSRIHSWFGPTAKGDV